MQAVVILILLIAVGGVIAIAFNMQQKGDDTVNKPQGNCATCNGTQKDKCEQICQLEAAARPVVYYDDEELDRYSGRPSESYTDDEATEFENIMLTMRPEEVIGWSRSLILRGINVPNQIKDEMIAIIQEQK